MADASRGGGNDVPRAPASPTSPAMVPSDVRVTVDGHEFTTELVTEGVQVTENDVITRLGQQSEILKHVNFLFANTEDRVKMHLIQKQGEQERLRKQLADVTAERDAARANSGQNTGQVKEANRERDVAQSAEFEARTAVVNKSNEIQKINAPRFKELTVSKVYDMVKDIPGITVYLPSDISGEKLNRSFLFDVSQLLNVNVAFLIDC